VSVLVTDDERLRGRLRPPEAPVMRQVWRHLGFLHYAVDAAALAATLPPGLEVDLFEGVAYVGLVPFTIPLSRLPGLGVPLAPPFHELNARTYVHRGGRHPGVWFFSLDAASRLAVWGARAVYGLPYFHADMSMRVSGADGQPDIAYSSRRLSRKPASVAAELSGQYGPSGPAAAARPGTLEFFLAERYLLYSWNGRRLATARVFHAPYPLQSARAEVTETVTAAAGLSISSPPALVHYAREVDVRIYRPRRVEAGA
jgi:uncharacterized protein YqjF (DUF2071 family)